MMGQALERRVARLECSLLADLEDSFQAFLIGLRPRAKREFCADVLKMAGRQSTGDLASDVALVADLLGTDGALCQHVLDAINAELSGREDGL